MSFKYLAALSPFLMVLILIIISLVKESLTEKSIWQMREEMREKYEGLLFYCAGVRHYVVRTDYDGVWTSSISGTQFFNEGVLEKILRDQGEHRW